MRYPELGLVLAFVLYVSAGCASTDGSDPPPWQRPGLGNGKVMQVLAKAAKDNDDQMTMTSDRDLATSDLAKHSGD